MFDVRVTQLAYMRLIVTEAVQVLGGHICNILRFRLSYSRLHVRLNMRTLRDLLRNPIIWTRSLSTRLTR